jgi:tetratricopeptide (TPR) repeat protein
VSRSSPRRPAALARATGLLLALLSGAPAEATTLLEATQGVVGRGVDAPRGAAATAAQREVEARDWDEAARLWSEAAGADDPLVPLLWEVACLVHGDLDEAAQKATLALLAEGPEDPAVLLMAAWVLHELGHAEQAARLLDDFPRHHADALGADILRMRALTQAGALRKADRVRRRALRREDLDAWFWLEAGLEDAWAGAAEADLLLERATRARGASAFHSVVRMRFLEAEERPGDAVDEGLRAMARYPDDQVLPQVLASILRRPEAEVRLRAALRAQPDHPSGNAVLGIVLMGRDDLAAAAHLQRAIDLGEEDAELFLALSQVLVREGELGLAFAAIQRGAARHPGHPELVATGMAMAHAEGDEGAQLQLLDGMAQAGAERPESARAALLVASNLDPARPATAWTEALQGLPDALLLPGSLRDLVAGEALASLGRGPEAELAYGRALAGRSSDVLSLAAFARFLLVAPAAPDLARGQALAEQATRAAGDEAAALRVVAAALWDGGQAAQAIDLLARAVARDPDDAAARDRLGRWRSSIPGESP